MIGIDSNVLLRYIVRDDAEQTLIADAFMQSLTDKRLGFICIVTLIETIWVLKSIYRHDRHAVRRFLELLLSAPVLQVQYARLLEDVVHDSYALNVDVTDGVISALGVQAGCSGTVTFDRRASRINGMNLLN
jgi:predicted nucleic-acid-binding protein